MVFGWSTHGCLDGVWMVRGRASPMMLGWSPQPKQVWYGTVQKRAAEPGVDSSPRDRGILLAHECASASEIVRFYIRMVHVFLYFYLCV